MICYTKTVFRYISVTNYEKKI